MSEKSALNDLLVETLRTQELLKIEFQRMVQALEAQSAELLALRQANAALLQQVTERLQRLELSPTREAFSLPYGLKEPYQQQKERSETEGVFRDIQRAFYPPPSPQGLSSAFIRYRQVMGLDMDGKRIGVLTTGANECAELQEATLASKTVELRLHTINGPFTVIRRNEAGYKSELVQQGDIESAVLHLENCDVLWIPDPFLSSLILRCQGTVERISERIRERFLFSIRTEDWREDDARMRVHLAGFNEISRLLESAENAYVTRFHEARGFYVHRAPRDMDAPPPETEILLASKIPEPSFRFSEPSISGVTP